MMAKFFILSSMIYLMIAQTGARSIVEGSNLSQATAQQKNRLFKTSFNLADENKDGFVTMDEFEKTTQFKDSDLPFSSLIHGAFTEAFLRYLQEKNR